MTLAVGLNNGDINIYNVKREGDKFEVLIFALVPSSYTFIYHLSVC